MLLQTRNEARYSVECWSPARAERLGLARSNHESAITPMNRLQERSPRIPGSLLRMNAALFESPRESDPSVPSNYRGKEAYYKLLDAQTIPDLHLRDDPFNSE
jgi:hypothetical protein